MEVSPQRLRSVAAVLNDLASRLGSAPRPGPDPAGWATLDALRLVAAEWDAYLAGYAARLVDVADRLVRAADGYQAADRAARDACRAVGRALSGLRYGGILPPAGSDAEPTDGAAATPLAEDPAPLPGDPAEPAPLPGEPAEPAPLPGDPAPPAGVGEAAQSAAAPGPEIRTAGGPPC